MVFILSARSPIHHVLHSHLWRKACAHARLVSTRQEEQDWFHGGFTHCLLTYRNFHCIVQVAPPFNFTKLHLVELDNNHPVPSPTNKKNPTYFSMLVNPYFHGTSSASHLNYISKLSVVFFVYFNTNDISFVRSPSHPSHCRGRSLNKSLRNATWDVTLFILCYSLSYHLDHHSLTYKRVQFSWLLVHNWHSDLRVKFHKYESENFENLVYSDLISRSHHLS